MRLSMSVMLIVASLGQVAAGQVRTVWEDFGHASSLDASQRQNHAAIVEEARAALFEAFTEGWLALGGTPDERQARQAALAEARHELPKFVSLEVREGPFQRLGTNGFVRVRGTVNLSAMQALFQARLSQQRAMPRHRVLVLISEYNRGARSEFAKATAAIQQSLTRAGWPVVSDRQLEKIRARNLDYARLDHAGQELLARIALEQNAAIIIAGSVRARLADAPIVAGERVSLYAVDCTLEAAWADTGIVIGALVAPPGRTTYPSAERALAEVARDVGEQCTRIFAELEKTRALRVIVNGIESLEQEQMVRQWLATASGPRELPSGRFTGQRLTMTVETDLTPLAFAQQVTEAARVNATDYELVPGERSAGEITFRLQFR